MTLAEATQLAFFQRAILAGILASVACGIIGTYVVTKRMASISWGLSHAAFGGVGIGYFLGGNPIIGAVIFTIISAIVIGTAYLRQNQTLDTLIAIMWSLGMAVGVVFISLAPGYTPDLSGYLFGSILFVPYDYVCIVALLDLLLLLVVFLWKDHFEAVCFDEEYARVTGLHVDWIFLSLLILTSLAVVMLMRVVGVIMLIAMLTTPAVIAQQWSGSLRRMMIVATAVAGICTVGGLFLNYYLSAMRGINIPTGPLIIIASVLFYGISTVAKQFASRPKQL